MRTLFISGRTPTPPTCCSTSVARTCGPPSAASRRRNGIGAAARPNADSLPVGGQRPGQILECLSLLALTGEVAQTAGGPPFASPPEPSSTRATSSSDRSSTVRLPIDVVSTEEVGIPKGCVLDLFLGTADVDEAVGMVDPVNDSGRSPTSRRRSGRQPRWRCSSACLDTAWREESASHTAVARLPSDLVSCVEDGRVHGPHPGRHLSMHPAWHSRQCCAIPLLIAMTANAARVATAAAAVARGVGNVLIVGHPPVPLRSMPVGVSLRGCAR
jgi:hypothetical protein